MPGGADRAARSERSARQARDAGGVANATITVSGPPHGRCKRPGAGTGDSTAARGRSGECCALAQSSRRRASVEERRRWTTLDACWLSRAGTRRPQSDLDAGAGAAPGAGACGGGLLHATRRPSLSLISAWAPSRPGSGARWPQVCRRSATGFPPADRRPAAPVGAPPGAWRCEPV